MLTGLAQMMRVVSTEADVSSPILQPKLSGPRRAWLLHALLLMVWVFCMR